MSNRRGRHYDEVTIDESTVDIQSRYNKRDQYRRNDQTDFTAAD